VKDVLAMDEGRGREHEDVDEHGEELHGDDWGMCCCGGR
jgi:hypothetical protein